MTMVDDDDVGCNILRCRADILGTTLGGTSSNAFIQCGFGSETLQRGNPAWLHHNKIAIILAMLILE